MNNDGGGRKGSPPSWQGARAWLVYLRLLAQLAYFIGARLGRAHCALCEVTHGLVRERPEWKQCRQTLAVPFAMYHLNDRPLAVSTACGGVAPVVLAETDDGMVLLLSPDGLSACAGSVERFASALLQAADHARLAWPT